ncbi:MAG: diphthine synthase [Candidatus Woesearchaeota archaeon]
MLTLIGLGLCDEKDITLKGLEAIKKAEAVYLEGYTSLLQVPISALEELYKKEVIVLDREAVEITIENVLEKAKNKHVCLLIIGDVFSATTHSDVYLRAKNLGVDVRVIHNASILNAIGQTGIDLYRFGRTTTLVYPEKSYRPESFYDVIAENLSRNLHTLCLLDIKTDQDRYMSVPEAIELLLDIDSRREEQLLTNKTGVGVARITSPNQHIKYGLLTELKTLNWGKPPHTLIIPARLHEIEEEMLLSHNQ